MEPDGRTPARMAGTEIEGGGKPSWDDWITFIQNAAP